MMLTLSHQVLVFDALKIEIRYLIFNNIPPSG
jgi:hypothetical protein